MNKNIKYYFITAIITMAIFIFIYVCSNAFGNTFFISDLYEQYLPLFTKLSNIFNGDSFFYNFNGALGNSFLETFFYYLASPFNLLLFLFNDLNKFVVVITLLKILTASLTAFTYFNYHFKDHKLYSTIFSIIYAFLTYNIIYSFHIMWLDAIYLLPLVLLGVDKVIQEKKSLLFIISLAVTIFTNYYFGYMICIFSFLYFNYKFLLLNNIKHNIIYAIKENLKFVSVLIFTLLLCAFILLPIISTISNYSRGTLGFLNGENFNFNLNIFDFIRQFFIASNIENEFLNPNKYLLYSSVISLPLLIFYFLNNNIKKKEKILSAVFIFIFFLSTSCNYLNYLWHGFTAPQFFNGRFTFMFSFFILLMNYKSLLNIKYISQVKYLLTLLSLVIILFILLALSLPTSDMYINIVFIITYMTILYFINFNKTRFSIALIILISIELITNGIVELNSYQYKNKNIYSAHTSVYNNILNYIYKYDDSKFYRIENNITDPYNYPLLNNYYGIDTFLSTIRRDVSDFFINVGYSSGNTKINTISYYSGTEVIDSILGIKYHVAFDEYDYNNRYIIINKYYTKWVNQEDIKVSIYENPYALSIGYMVTDNIKNIHKDINVFKYQNILLSSMSGLDKDIYTLIELNDELSFTNFLNKEIYFYSSIDVVMNYNKYSVYLNSEKLTKTNDFEIIKKINSFDIRETLSFDYTNINYAALNGSYAAYYNEDIFDEHISELKKNELIIEIFNSDYISGYVDATNEKSILFTTIPYDDNWDVYIDGKKTKSIKVIDTMLAIELENGKHKIELKYRPKEFLVGIFVSFITLLLAILFKLKKSLNK